MVIVFMGAVVFIATGSKIKLSGLCNYELLTLYASLEQPIKATTNIHVYNFISDFSIYCSLFLILKTILPKWNILSISKAIYLAWFFYYFFYPSAFLAKKMFWWMNTLKTVISFQERTKSL